MQVYDFQLIKTQSSVLVDQEGKSTGVQLVSLNEKANNPAPGDVLQAVGFGTVVPDGHTGNSEVLMDVTLQSFANDHCSSQYGSSLVREDVMICVGEPSGFRDTCQGMFVAPKLCTLFTARASGGVKQTKGLADNHVILV